jgi:cellulose 1,4-beta-cellobiosidase
MFKTLTLLSFVVAQALSQQAGTLVPEIHPALPAQHCTKIGCKAVNTSLTLDANFRWLHNTAGFTNCDKSFTTSATLPAHEMKAMLAVASTRHFARMQ